MDRDADNLDYLIYWCAGAARAFVTGGAVGSAGSGIVAYGAVGAARVGSGVGQDPSIGVDSSLLQLGLNPDHTIQVPPLLEKTPPPVGTNTPRRQANLARP